jgi:crotonobetainyl-CoA:carnitine CoA-transferase CaiB-like acyl-CoA transferase
VQFGIDVDVPIAPCHTPKTVADDPQFTDRLAWFPTEALGAEQLPFPVRIVGTEPVVPGKAPELGQHTDAVLADVLGYDAERVAALRAAGAVH